MRRSSVSLGLKEALDIGAAALTLAGGVIGALGTFYLLRWYQFFSGWDFVISTFETSATIVKGGIGKAIERVSHMAKLNPNPEDKAAAVVGIHVIFIGFGLQCLGALLATASAILQSVRQVQ
jgi:hypothetical protein